MIRIFIGYDDRETAAYHVLSHSILSRASCPVSITPLNRKNMAWFRRPRGEFDSTDFAISRFLVPYLCGYQGWALFMDCDMLVTGDVAEFDGYASMFNHYGRAVRVVKHEYVPKGERKFLGQAQTQYGRKNWSSVMLFNCAHAACRKLTLEYVENAPGLELHQFKWCDDQDIGGLPEGWNYLVGEQNQCERDQIRNLHYTQGTPCFPEYASCEFAEVWHREREKMLAAG